MAKINDIRKTIPGEVFDFQQLMACLGRYAKPRDKISSMLRAGQIIRIKKGLYVFGEDYRRRPWSRELLANLIYGPSYVSLDYALAYYGLIPERVEVVTSVTTSKTRRFVTALGTFSYRHVALRKYRIGVDQITQGSSAHFLIAAPAKALVDKIWIDSRFAPRKMADYQDYLHSDLRIDPDALERIDLCQLESIADQFGSRKIRLLLGYLRAQQGAN